MAQRTYRPKDFILFDILDFYKVNEDTGELCPTELKKQYIRTYLRTHPDKNPNDPMATELSQAIGQAYKILSDEEWRVEYYVYGTKSFQNGDSYREEVTDSGEQIRQYDPVIDWRRYKELAREMRARSGQPASPPPETIIIDEEDDNNDEKKDTESEREQESPPEQEFETGPEQEEPESSNNAHSRTNTTNGSIYENIEIDEILDHRDRGGKLTFRVKSCLAPAGLWAKKEEVITQPEVVAEYLKEVAKKKPKRLTALFKKHCDLSKLFKKNCNK